MSPGRELDAVVAEKVMGLSVRPIEVIGASGVHADVGTVDLPRRMPDGRMGVHAAPLPAYSTEIAAAWEVVEKLRSPVFVLEWEPDRWLASFCGEDEDATADTAPHAICLAALKAVEAAT